jgi:hypothetical protein
LTVATAAQLDIGTTPETKVEERTEERKLLVHKTAFDMKTVEGIVDENKVRFFKTMGFFKPRRDEIECESVQLYYEPFIVAKASYFLDYYRNRTYTVRTNENVREVIAFGQTFQPAALKKGLWRRPSKAIAIDVQERIVRRAAAHMVLNRVGREVKPSRLPSGPTESEPRNTLEQNSDRVRDLETSPSIILDQIRKRIVRRPADVSRIRREAFEVTEYALVCTPIYEARCRRLKTGEIRILPISGVTGRTLRL